MQSYREWIDGLAVKHKKQGILLDTNTLLLLIFSLYDSSQIGSKRLSKYTEYDSLLLINYVQRFDWVLTTPHVLAETSNLARQIVTGTSWNLLSRILFPLFCLKLPNSFEQLTIQDHLVDSLIFDRLGLTDSCLTSLVVHSKPLLLTDDFDLFIAAASTDGDAINFTHMREDAGVV